MAAYTLSPEHIRHPWFSGVSLKRKQSDSDEDEEAYANSGSRPLAPGLSHSNSYDELYNPYVNAAPSSSLDMNGLDERRGGAGVPPTVRFKEAHENKRRKFDTIERRLAKLKIETASNGSAGTSCAGVTYFPNGYDGYGPQAASMVDEDIDLDDADTSASVPRSAYPRSPYPQPSVTHAPSLYNSDSHASEGRTASTDSYSSNSSRYVASSPDFPPGTVFPHYDIFVEEPASPQFDANLPLPSGNALRLGRSSSSSSSTDGHPLVQEMNAKSTEPSWYEREKDRIVITDLDKVIQEVEASEAASNVSDEYKSEAEPHPDAAEYADSNADYSISNLLLSHIQRQANFPFDPSPARAEENRKVRALVLFKPPLIVPPPARLPLAFGSDSTPGLQGQGNAAGDLDGDGDDSSRRMGGGEGAIGYGGYGDDDIEVQDINAGRSAYSDPSRIEEVDDDAMDVEP